MMLGFAVVKIILGVFLATVFQIMCPGGCECTGQVHDYLYPGIVFAVSLYWIISLGRNFMTCRMIVLLIQFYKSSFNIVLPHLSLFHIITS